MDRSENGLSNLLANRMPSLNSLSSNLQQLRTDLVNNGANNNQLNNANLMNAFNLAGLPQLAGLWDNNQLISAMSQYMEANNSLLNLKQESSSLENNQQQNLKRNEDDDLENKCNKDVLDLKINHSNKRFKSDGFVQNEQQKSNSNNKLSKDSLNFLDNGRSYPCPECHKTFATEVDLKMHLLRHVMQHPFSCSTCGKGFKYEHTLAFHEKQHGIDSSNKLNLKNSNKKSLTTNHQQQKNDLLDEKGLLVSSNRKSKYSSTTSSSSTKLQQHLEDEDLDNNNIPVSLLAATTTSAMSKLNNSIQTTNSKQQLNQNSSSLFSSSTDSNASYDFGFPNSAIPNLGIQMKSEKVLIVMVEGVNPLNDQTYTLYKCNICGFAFANLAPVTEHIMTVHSSNQKFNCDKCGANFKWRNELLLHDQIHKAMEQQQVANNKLMINNLLVNQYLNASGDLKLDSNNNDNLLLNSNNLNGHLINGDQLLDKNNLIGLNLTKNQQRKDSESSQESLNLTTKTKNGGRSKELKNDELDELSKKIAVVKQNTSNDELGEIEETAPGQFKCRYCDKTFDRVFSVHRHERVHTGFKPCICKVCGKGFSELRNLRHHLIRFHSDGSGRELLRRVRKDKFMNIEENNAVKRQLKAMEMNILSMNNNSLQSNTGSDEDLPLGSNSKDCKQANGDHDDTNSNHSGENLNNNHKTSSSSRRRKSVPYKVNTSKIATSTTNSSTIIEQMDTEDEKDDNSSSRSDQISIKDEDSNNGCNNDERLND